MALFCFFNVPVGPNPLFLLPNNDYCVLTWHRALHLRYLGTVLLAMTLATMRLHWLDQQICKLEVRAVAQTYVIGSTSATQTRASISQAMMMLYNIFDPILKN